MKGIYCIYCKADDKRYIGQSVHISKRKVEHLNALLGNYHTNDHLQSAFNKYGSNSFEFSILEKLPENTTQETLNEREIYWIDKYNSSDRECGYNKTAGGSHGIYFYYKTDEELKEIKQHMSESAKVKIFTESHRRNLGKAAKGRKLSEKSIQKLKSLWTEERRKNAPKGKDHPWYKRKHTKESLKKISESLRSRNDGIEVICLNTYEVFPSSQRAGEFYKVDRSQILKVCKNTPKYNTAGKHPVTNERLRWMYYKDFIERGGDY